MVQKNYQTTYNDSIRTKRDWMTEIEYRMALCETHTFVFECELLMDTFSSLKEDWEDLFGETPDNYNQAYEKGLKSCYSADRERFKDTFEQGELHRAWNRGEIKKRVECRLYTNNQGYHWFLCTLLLFGDERGRLKSLVCCGSDQNQRKQEEEAVTYQVSHDELTDTLNWRAGQEMLEHYLKLDDGRQAAFILVDIDDFKSINDEYGIDCGDQVLCRAADIMRKFVTDPGWLIRRGGDEFIIFVEMENPEKVRYILSQILADFRTYLKIEKGDKDIPITASVGVALYPKHAKAAERLYECAEYALRHSKISGKNTYSLYDWVLESQPVREDITKELDLMRWEELDDVIYMSDPVTHELYYMNRIAREGLGVNTEDYKGRKCYEVIQGRPNPCVFCKKHKLKVGQSCVWKYHNMKFNADFFVKDRIIIRDGKEVHMEMAIRMNSLEWEDGKKHGRD